jgi:ABC-2 type transport system permease protein
MSDGTEVELRDVRGPSALGGGWQRFAELLYLISVNEFKKTYFGTALGYLWSLLRPLLLFAVLLFVFTQVFRLGSQVPHYPVLLLFNIVLFGFFQEATTQAVTSVVAQEGIVRKTQFPRLVIPIAPVMTALFNLCVNMVVVLGFMIGFGVYPHGSWLAFPVIVAGLAVLTSAVSMLLSCLYVRYRDVAIIWSVFATALFYATPILYSYELFPEKYREVLALNPLTPVFIESRKLFIDPSAPGVVQAMGGWGSLLLSLGIGAAICVVSVWYFLREAPRVAEEL